VGILGNPSMSLTTCRCSMSNIIWPGRRTETILSLYTYGNNVTGSSRAPYHHRRRRRRRRTHCAAATRTPRAGLLPMRWRLRAAEHAYRTPPLAPGTSYRSAGRPMGRWQTRSRSPSRHLFRIPRHFPRRISTATNAAVARLTVNGYNDRSSSSYRPLWYRIVLNRKSYPFDV